MHIAYTGLARCLPQSAYSRVHWARFALAHAAPYAVVVRSSFTFMRWAVQDVMD